MINKHHNFIYSGGFPLAVGDRYYSQDLGRDFDYLRDLIGATIYDQFSAQSKIIMSGGAVSQVAGQDKIDITALVGYVPFSVDIPDSYAALPPSTVAADIILARVVAPAQTALVLGSATFDGSTPNYIKVKYAEADGNTRARAIKAGTYAYEKTPSYTITCDSTAPTAYEICLGSFTSNGGGGAMTFDWSDKSLTNNIVYPTGANDHLNIQGAINYWGNHGGGLVQLTEGTHDIAAVISMKSGVILQGRGDATVLDKNVAFADAEVILIDTGVVDIQVNNLLISGANANVSTKGIANADATNMRMKFLNVTVQNMSVLFSVSAVTFYKCNNLFNCRSTVSGGFDSCNHLFGCIADTTQNFGGFSSCNYLEGCQAFDGNKSDGFVSCNYLSNCYAANNTETPSGANGFNTCTFLSGCYAYNNNGIGFKSCTHVSNSNAASNPTYGFEACKSVLGCKSVSAGTAYHSSYADSGTGNACADTAAGGYNS